MSENSKREDIMIACALLMTSIQRSTSARGPHQAALLSNLSLARAAFDDGSAARLMVDATRLVGVVEKCELEESSTRFLITFRAANSANGQSETIRSMRTDSPGFAYLKEYIPSLIGRRCLIYKTNEAQSGNSGDKGRTVRISPCIIPISSRER